MTGFLDRVREAVRGEPRVDADRLVDRLDALGRFLRAVDGRIPDERLGAARTLVERAGVRLALSREHTVVALAGATGSGKSSIFNTLAGMSLSPVGVRRPTTGYAHACVWGANDGATELLDWVGVLPRHRFVRESALDGGDEAALHGLVLLDLPDFDSVEYGHRLEVDRLLGLVDLVVWVVDPQKYADRVIHRNYLGEFRRNKDVTVVVLNQADRLEPAELPRLLTDLRRLLDADALDGIPLLATSALVPASLTELRGLLERTVTARQAALRRLNGDLDVVTDQLAVLVGTTRAEEDVNRGSVRRLSSALASAAAVPTVAEAVESAYRHRAAAATGWPLTRAWRKLRPDPLLRLHLLGSRQADGRHMRADSVAAVVDAGGGRPELERTPLPLTSLPQPTAAQRAAVDLAVRGLADQAGSRLPVPWPAAVTAAARSQAAELPDALDRAVGGTELNLAGRPLWWRLVGALQWLLTATAFVGLGWLLVGFVIRTLGLPALEYPTVGALPVPTGLLLGGLLGGIGLSLLIRPVTGWAARRARRRAEDRLTEAVTEVARRHVVDPVREVLAAYGEARDALEQARSTR
ncbi:GTPase [Micromonospora sp. NBC_01813]|uniref:GTPase n=1 Tax=Micromonospora sp. NBC_01813 TaxID=2975988 RepID=UPI002DD89BE0|nr:GTPase [Micromonospora sp. NBC_01813]WSA07419.1 50S ribosome-binding GTPase [Micromonospora sp. NBC_01813]